LAVGSWRELLMMFEDHKPIGSRSRKLSTAHCLLPTYFGYLNFYPSFVVTDRISAEHRLAGRGVIARFQFVLPAMPRTRYASGFDFASRYRTALMHTHAVHRKKFTRAPKYGDNQTFDQDLSRLFIGQFGAHANAV